MLILLPPSEKKRAPTNRKSLNLSGISFAQELTSIRQELLAQHAEVDQSRTAPAYEVYSGFLYQALDYLTLSEAAKERAGKEVIIFSALYGAIHIEDEISAYKFKIQNSLWREGIRNSLDQYEQHLIVDCRSSTYVSTWVPPPRKTIKIRVLTQIRQEAKVVTHMAKVTRGQVARFLLQSEATPKTPFELQSLLSKQFICTLEASDEGKPWSIDILTNY